MPPLPVPATPRIVIYYQSHHKPDGVPVSVLPLITTPNTTVTHLIIAALHLNDPPGNIHLNDHPPQRPGNQTLWAELSVLRASGVKVLGMLGGAARGSFARLDRDEETFEAYYTPLRDLIRERSLDGLDLDVEEPMTLAGVIRLIDRLKADFGDEFLVTLAPVAGALLSSQRNLSGFDYEALEVLRGSSIAWYNTQFYCGWGDMSSTSGYDMIVARGFPPSKVVVGMVTNPANGAGWVPFEILQEVLLNLKLRYGNAFGGVMGWEYFNSLPGDRDRPWEWATFMTRNTRSNMEPLPVTNTVPTGQKEAIVGIVDGESQRCAPLPDSFEYFTDDD
ncbi:MAG: hypothetical protein M1818_004572 [Claussenomyces sp. TS43310]|nr:MAG: hypothetical protein M1818_004572 [Claussenomyces sp. TS43310]